jgi:hypothetical protein
MLYRMRPEPGLASLNTLIHNGGIQSAVPFDNRARSRIASDIRMRRTNWVRNYRLGFPRGIVLTLGSRALLRVPTRFAPRSCCH